MASQTGIAAAGRRTYSSWEQSGPDLEALDEADSLGTQSSIPCIGLGTPVPSPGAGVGTPASPVSTMAPLATATPAPVTVRKRAVTESQGRQGGSVIRRRYGQPAPYDD